MAAGDTTIIVPSGGISVIGNLINDGSLTIEGGTAVAPFAIASVTGTGTLSVGDSSSSVYMQILAETAAGVDSSSQSSFTMTSGSTLDLTNQPFYINYGTSADPIATIYSYLATSYDNDKWDQPGITSSLVSALDAAQSSLAYSVGYADGVDGIVSGLDSGQIEIMPTLAGDARMEGNVVFGDDQLFSQYFDEIGYWDHGDFTYNGMVDFGDFQLIAEDYGANDSGLFRTVPEPTPPPAVTLSLVASNGDWTAYAQADSSTDNIGLASMAIDVVGSNGAAVTSSFVDLPNAENAIIAGDVNQAESQESGDVSPDGYPLAQAGFFENASNGQGDSYAITSTYPDSAGDGGLDYTVIPTGGDGIDILAQQAVFSQNGVIQGFGQTAGSGTGAAAGLSWGAAPVQIAHGTYSGYGTLSVTPDTTDAEGIQTLIVVSNGKWKSPGNLTTDTVIPGTVTVAGGLTVTSISGSEIILNWSSLTIPSSATGLTIEESANGIGGWDAVATADPTALGAIVDMPLASDTAYYFQLVATEANGSGGTQTVDIGGVLPVTTPLFPTAPTGLTATPVSGNEVNLSWSDSADDETEFVIYRSGDGGSDWEQVGQVGSATFSYSDTNVLDDTSYEYEVAAMNAAGNLSAFNVAAGTVTTPLDAPTGLTYGISYSTPYSSEFDSANSNDNIPAYPYFPVPNLTWISDSAAAVTTNLEVSDYSNFSSYGSVSLSATQESFLLAESTAYTMIRTLNEPYSPEEAYILYPGTYYVRMQSVDGAGTVSPWSSTLTLTVPALPPDLPASVIYGWDSADVSYTLQEGGEGVYSGGGGDSAPTYSGWLDGGVFVSRNTSDEQFAPASAASHGAVNIQSNGSFTYTPDEDYTGEDSFTYVAIDASTGQESQPSRVELQDYGSDGDNPQSDPFYPYGYPPGDGSGELPIMFSRPSSISEGGDLVSQTDIVSENPAVLTVPTDNVFYDEDPSGALDDMDYNTSLIAEGQPIPLEGSTAGVYKFATIFLSSYYDWPVQINASNWASIRIYNSAGMYYSPSELTGGLAGSTNNDNQFLYVEGVEANPDLQLTVTIGAPSGYTGTVFPFSETINMSIVDPTITDTSGDALNGAPFLPEEELAAAAAAPTDSDPVVQGIAQNFQNDYAGAEFNILLNGIPASDVQELLVDGQQIPVTDSNGSAETAEPLLIDAGGNLSTQEVQTLDSLIGGYVVPQYAQVEIETPYDDLYFTLPSAVGDSSDTGIGGGPSSSAPISADFYFDGTDNNGDVDAAQDAETNIWLMSQADSAKYVNYWGGVGAITAVGLLSGYQGSINGVGGDQIIDWAFGQLEKDLQAGATVINVFGFSRGGAEALEFLNRLDDALTGTKNPIATVNTLGGFIKSQVFGTNQYTTAYLTTNNIKVNFVGLFDPVASFAGSEPNDKRLYLPPDVDISYFSEAIAIGEHRYYFNLIPIENHGIPHFVQMGFIGSHADVGGGYGTDDGISNETLHWMMNQATIAGLVFNKTYSNYNAPYDVNQIHDSYSDPSGSAYGAIVGFASRASSIDTGQLYAGGVQYAYQWSQLRHTHV